MPVRTGYVSRDAANRITQLSFYATAHFVRQIQFLAAGAVHFFGSWSVARNDFSLAPAVASDDCRAAGRPVVIEKWQNGVGRRSLAPCSPTLRRYDDDAVGYGEGLRVRLQ